MDLYDGHGNITELSNDVDRLKSDIDDLNYDLYTISNSKLVTNIDGIVERKLSNATVPSYAISLGNHGGYDSYYFVATKEMNLYVDDKIPSEKYYAICIGHNYTGIEYKETYINLLSSNTARYRNTENTLPTKKNPLHIVSGDVV